MNHLREFFRRDRLILNITTTVMAIAAFIAQRLADGYVDGVKGTVVNDLFLDHIPVMDIDGLIIITTLAFSFIIVSLFIAKPRYLHIGIKTVALFVITRSFFITLTHLGSNPHELQFSTTAPGYWLYNFFYNTHGDFFFSGHTGLPFLMALIFWHEKPWRYFCLAASIIFGASVIFAHIHYSIDVFAAPFMSYGIYMLSTHLFPADVARARKNSPVR